MLRKSWEKISMRNARVEILEHTEGMDVEYVSVAYCPWYDLPPKKIKGTLEEVLDLLDFNYDNGYGSQELFGYIWYTDGTWSDRYEYDGSECWSHNVRPDKDVEILGYL